MLTMSGQGATARAKDKDKGQKTSKSRRETAVQGTNDSSIVSKCSMANQGYVDDPYLQAFVTKVIRRAPLIHRGYYIRAKTIDYLLHQFFKQNPGSKQTLENGIWTVPSNDIITKCGNEHVTDERTGKVISLGAGFDSTYFRLKSLGLLNDVVIYEVDFGDVVKRKAALIKSHPEILELLGEINTVETDRSPLIELAAGNYKLLGVDLTQINTLEAALKLCDVDFDAPTLLLSECVLTYLTRRCASTVVSWAAETFGNSVFIMYEQINPDDAFGLFMQNHFHSVGSPLKSINSFPTMQSQKERFLNLGWSSVEAMDMNQFYSRLVNNKERNRVEHLEPFDEYEEWHLKCAHYMVLCSYHGDVAPLLADVSGKPAEDSNNAIVMQDHGIHLSFPTHGTPLRRFGHGTVALDNNTVLTVGGFGEQNGKHMRVTDLVFTDLVTMEMLIVEPGVRNKDIEVSRMHSTISILNDGRVILIGGRMSPMRLCSQTVAITVGHVTSNRGWSGIQNGGHSSDAKDMERCQKVVTSVVNSENGSESAVKWENVMNCGKHIGMNCENKSAMNCERKSAMNCEICENHSVCVMNCEGVTPNVEITNTNCDENVKNKNQELLNNCDIKQDSVIIRNSIAQSVENVDMNCESETKLCNSTSENPTNVKDEETNIEDEIHTTEEETPKKPDMGEKSFISEASTETGMKEDTVSCTIIQPGGEVPSPRWRHTAVVCDIAGAESIVVFGGRSDKTLALNDCYAYTTATNLWRQPPTTGTSPEARQSHAACVWNGHLFISGGLNSDLHPLTSVMLLDLETHVWSEVSCNILPRYSHTAHVVGDYMVLVGGVSFSHTPPGVAIIHLPSGKSMEFALPKSEKANLVMLHKHTSVAIDNDRILVFGGGGNCFSFGTHLNSTPIVLDISKAIQMMNKICDAP